MGVPKEELRAHALAWFGAANSLADKADKALPPQSARLLSLSILANEVGRAYAALSEGKHPIPGWNLETGEHTDGNA